MDRANNLDAEIRLPNLLEIVEAKGITLGEMVWRGPAIGTDDEPRPGVNFDIVSDDKVVPMTVCEESN